MFNVGNPFAIDDFFLYIDDEHCLKASSLMMKNK
jgi:hypothetical protein